jgi:hypothetical protein
MSAYGVRIFFTDIEYKLFTRVNIRGQAVMIAKAKENMSRKKDPAD